MSFSFSDDTGDGNKVTFPFTFVGPDNGYYDEDSIVAEVDGVETSFTLTGPNEVTFATAPEIGAQVRIYRKPDMETTYTDFQRGNNFGKNNINRSFQHLLYLWHRLADGFHEDGHYYKQDVNMGENKLTNLAEGTEDSDAVTYGQIGDAPGYAADAEASAVAALASENNAADSEDAAAASEAKAEKWADEDEDVEVETDKYSAKHWSAKAEQFGVNVISDLMKTVLDDETAGDVFTTLGVTAFVQSLFADSDASTRLSSLGFSSFVQTLINGVDAAAFLTDLGVSTFIQTILDNADAATVRTTIDAAEQGGEDQIKAWITFNGTGTIAILDSFNVTSITDNGTGNYTITWGTDFANTDYAWAGGGKDTSAAGDVIIGVPDGGIKTKSAMQIKTVNSGGSSVDYPEVCIIAIGDQ